MNIPKYAQEIASRAHFGAYHHPKCSPGYTIVIRKATPYTYAETLRAECERLCSWARKHYAEAEILEMPTETRHCFQFATVTITDPVMKYLEKYITD